MCTSTERLCIAAWVTHSGVAATARAERAASGLSGFRGAKQTWALLAPLQKLCPISAGHASQSTLQDVIRGECCASRRPRSCAPLLLLLAPTTLLTQVSPPRCSARRPSSRPDSLTAASRSRTTPSMDCPGSSARTHSAPSLSTGSKASSLASTSSFAVSYSLSLSPTCARSPALIEIGTCHPDTDLENKSVLQTLKESARDPTRTLVFNYASEALNNSFFLSTLVSTKEGEGITRFQLTRPPGSPPPPPPPARLRPRPFRQSCPKPPRSVPSPPSSLTFPPTSRACTLLRAPTSGS